MKAHVEFVGNVPAIAERFKNAEITGNTLEFPLENDSMRDLLACKNAMHYIFCGYQFTLYFR